MPTPGQVSLDHYNSCQHCSDDDRGYCDEGVRLARLCVELGQVCRICGQASEDNGLCWSCDEKRKMLAFELGEAIADRESGRE